MFAFGLALIPYFGMIEIYLRLVLGLNAVAPRIGRPRLHNLIRFWGTNFLRLGMLIAGPRVEKTGFEPEKDKPYLIISNHQSLIDIALLFWAFRKTHIKFVMKKELQHWIPNISPATRGAKFAFLDRKAGAKAAEAVMRPFAERLREENVGCVIFPEGTRSRTGDLRKFKVAGVKLLAEELDFEVLVVTIDNTWKAATAKHFVNGVHDLVMRIHIEEPRTVEAFRKDAMSAMNEVRELMRRRLAEFRGEEFHPEEAPADAIVAAAGR